MSFDEWYEQYDRDGGELMLFNTLDLAAAFAAGRSAGIAWAERFTAEQCCQLVADKLYNGCIIGAAVIIKEKFALEI